MSEFNKIESLWKSGDDQIVEHESLDLEMVNLAIKKQSIGITRHPIQT